MIYRDFSRWSAVKIICLTEILDFAISQILRFSSSVSFIVTAFNCAFVQVHISSFVQVSEHFLPDCSPDD